MGIVIAIETKGREKAGNKRSLSRDLNAAIPHNEDRMFKESCRSFNDGK